MKKTGLLILVVVLALGAIGVGYAAWSQTITIDGDVSTGTYDVVFENLSVTETDALGVGVVATSGPSDSNHNFDVTVTNGYPGYVGVAHFDVHNTGTVPAKVTSITVSGVDADYTAVVTGIAAGNVLAADGKKLDCQVTITLQDGASEGTANQLFTVTIVTDQGV